LSDGWVAEVATEKGHRLLAEGDFPAATDEQLARRDAVRRNMESRLREQNAAYTFQADDARQPALPEGDQPSWQEFAADCVECGACTNICPTCHCFYLYDQALGEQFERVRTWDSCLLGTYHRMAGGEKMKLTPRPRLASRLANRVLHKFTYSPQQYELLGCVGCGRCIDACLGAIDIREVVDRLGAGEAELEPTP
jgi:ferredoxin